LFSSRYPRPPGNGGNDRVSAGSDRLWISFGVERSTPSGTGGTPAVPCATGAESRQRRPPSGWCGGARSRRDDGRNRRHSAERQDPCARPSADTLTFQTPSAAARSGTARRGSHNRTFLTPIQSHLP
jgi:hypothetical protein